MLLAHYVNDSTDDEFIVLATDQPSDPFMPNDYEGLGYYCKRYYHLMEVKGASDYSEWSVELPTDRELAKRG